MKGASPVNIEAIGALLRASFCEREKNVEQFHRMEAGQCSLISCVPQAKRPRSLSRPGAKLCRVAAQLGPKRCRYSLELMNAFTISDSMKLPPNEFSLVSQKLNPDVSGSRRRYPKYSIVTKAALYSRVFR